MIPVRRQLPENRPDRPPRRRSHRHLSHRNQVLEPHLSGERRRPQSRRGRRANYVCYRLLRDHYREKKIRSLLAVKGVAPEIPPGAMVTAVRITQLPRYIQNGRGNLSPEEVLGIAQCLCRLNRPA